MQVAELQAEVAELKFDRSKWKRVRFDQLAQCVTDRVDNPSEAGVDRYVGLEHLDPYSLKLARWGSPSDVEATKLRFKPGDIIFGKRRAYQRKLAVADFEGICSAHSMVLRAKEGVAEGYLPAFMQSGAFFEVALKISVGGLSPTINWRELARQEFLLPPAPDQSRIANIVWACESVIQRHEALKDDFTALEIAASSQHFAEMLSGPKTPLSSVGKWLSGGTPSRSDQGYWSGSIPWISPKDMKSDELYDSEEHVTREAAVNGSKLIPPDSVIFVVRGMILAHTFPVCLTKVESSFNQDVKAILPNDRFRAKYLHRYLKFQHDRILKMVDEAGHGTKRLPTDALMALEVPLTDVDEQDVFCGKLEEYETFLRSIESLLLQTRGLKAALSEKIWGRRV